jgi:hypothetical protein
MHTQDSTPVLDAIRRFRDEGTLTFSLPGHRFGRGVDDVTAEVLSRDTFGADVIMAKSSVGEAEELYAQAVGARHAVFTTCGSSISIHTAILTLAGPGSRILVDRNVHKSVVASLILAGAEPVWLRPCWDESRQVAHPASAEQVAQALDQDGAIDAVILITPTEYGTGADVAGTAKLCHAHHHSNGGTDPPGGAQRLLQMRRLLIAHQPLRLQLSQHLPVQPEPSCCPSAGPEPRTAHRPAPPGHRQGSPAGAEHRDRPGLPGLRPPSPQHASG